MAEAMLWYTDANVHIVVGHGDQDGLPRGHNAWMLRGDRWMRVDRLLEGVRDLTAALEGRKRPKDG